jgi:hypothetical protein
VVELMYHPDKDAVVRDWNDRATPTGPLWFLCVCGRGSSAVEVAAAAPAVGFGP